ncbi:MAG TPA: hypothetical protein VHC69_23440 [Polyangiaceae bacterium]|nr:hypothetical protein [Polyangiaceae bacterium]
MPNICGNTRRVHRTLVLGSALACACTTVRGREETHTIVGHWASSLCRPAATEDGQFDFELEALGDFPPTTDTHESLKAGRELVVPGTTRAAWLTATDDFSSYLGLGTADDAANIDVSLWPSGSFCELSVATSSCAYPAGGKAYAMGVASDGRTLLIAGGDASAEQDVDPTTDVASSAAVIDLATSRTTCLPRDAALQVARAGATITPLGGGLLVAGGYDPSAGNAPVGSAETFDPTTHAFGADPITISARAHHGAVALASNEVLLVGGVDESGPIAEQALAAVAPTSPRYRKTGFAAIEPRIDPVVLRLSDDRVFIAGGTSDLPPSPAVQSLLWLDPTARTVVRTLPALSCDGDETTATVGSAFATMPGGAVLAVGGCTESTDGATQTCDKPCDNGAGCPSSEVFWIDRDGDVTCCGSGRQNCGGPAQDGVAPFVSPELVGGEDGRPWLFDGPSDSRAMQRFNPWTGQFEAPMPTDERGPASLARADAGLFVALDDCGADAPTPCSASVRGFRHGLRGPYSQAVAPLLLADTEGVALDRAPGAPPSPGAVATASWRNPANGQVQITPGSTLLVTDTTYEDVDVVVHVTAGPPPTVHLGSATFGKGSCQWPLTAPQPAFDAELTRRGGSVTLTVKGRARSCPGPSGRVAVSFAGDAPITLESITVTRIGD